MKTEIYTNRYGDKFTFTELPDGNIQWSGKFEYCRFGFPNDYSDAFKLYKEMGGTFSLEKFKEEVHRAIYNENGDYIKMSDISQVYGKLVKIVKDTIEMVDPSGGPYLTLGMEIMGKVIKEFKPNRDGYLIITEK